MSFDAKTASRMAKACDVCYYIGQPGGLTLCPFYGDVGFVEPPMTYVGNVINAALVGTTATEVVMAFRGTLPIDTEDWDDFIESVRDWLDDGEVDLVKVDYSPGLVHQGFSSSLESLWGQMLPAIRARQAATGLPVVITGHSKGGALASLAAIRLQHDAAITPAAVYTYGSARAGDTPFSRNYDQSITHDWRFENTDDLVPHLPPAAQWLDFLAKVDSRLSGFSAHAYLHVGLLEFLKWDGTIAEGNTLSLQGERMIHLFDLLATGRIKQCALDHSLENQYIAKLTASSAKPIVAAAATAAATAT